MRTVADARQEHREIIMREWLEIIEHADRATLEHLRTAARDTAQDMSINGNRRIIYKETAALITRQIRRF